MSINSDLVNFEMKSSALRLFFTFAFSLIVPWSASAAVTLTPNPNLWQPTQEERAALETSQLNLWNRFFPDGKNIAPNQSTVALASLIVNDLAISAPQSRISTAIKALASLQITDPKNKYFGHVYWLTNDTEITDGNDIVFVSNVLSVGYLLYRDRLGADDLKILNSFLDKAKVGIERYDVDIDYTNIYLLRTWGRLFLAQIRNDKAAHDRGITQLKEWISRVKKVGIHEFSTSYLTFDLNSLSRIVNLSNNPNAVTLAREGADLVWDHIAYHWYTPADRICGPASRNYDRLYSKSSVSALVARAGWSDVQNFETGPIPAYSFVAPRASVARPATTQQMVVERFGDNDNQRFTTYFEPGANGNSLCIGSAESQFFHHFPREGISDSLAIDLGAGSSIPRITTFMDGRGDFYGVNKLLHSPGHFSSTHLKTFVTSVQNGPELLYISSAQYNSATYTSLNTTFILPADADYWLDGKPLNFMHSYSKWAVTPAPDGVNTLFNVTRTTDGVNEVSLRDRSTSLPLGLSQTLPANAGDEFKARVELQGGPLQISISFIDRYKSQIGKAVSKTISTDTERFAVSEISATAPPNVVNVVVTLRSGIAAMADARIRNLNVARKPSNAVTGITVADFDFAPYVASNIVIPTKSTLVIRRQSTAVAIRPLGAWDVSGMPIQFRLINDGLSYGAIRMTAVHSAVNTNKRGTSAFWMTAKAGLVDSESFEAFLRTSKSAIAAIAFEPSGYLRSKSVNGNLTLKLNANVNTENQVYRYGAPVIDKAKARNVFKYQ